MTKFNNLIKRTNLFVLATLLALAQIVPYIAINVESVSADGQGSSIDCETAPNVVGSIGGEDNAESGDLVVHDVTSGYVVDGVCIKSGENMFNGNQHSEVLGNGTYENECYVVSGVGTQEVTVTRTGDGPNCQEISHIDVLKSEVQPVLGSISGYKWEDVNGDGLISGEQKLSGWTIQLIQNDQVINTQVTDNEGEYSFTGLTLGEYTVCEVNQIGWTQTYPETNSGCRTTELTEQSPDRSGKNYSFGNMQEPDEPRVIENLNLTSECTDYNLFVQNQRTWRITNPNEFDVDYELFRYGTSDSIAGVAKPGLNYVNLGAASSGPNTTILRWYNEQGQKKEKNKASNNQTCAHLTVTKYVDYENGGDVDALEFNMYVNDVLLNDNYPAKGKSGTEDGFSYATYEYTDVSKGVEYEISEDTIAGYTPSDVICTDMITDALVDHPVVLGNQAVNCKIINKYEPKVTVVAHKIVCEEEALLPNWGDSRGPAIDSLTAINWVTDNTGCEFVEGWSFEWALGGESNPGDNLNYGGSGWNIFGPTNENGQASAEIEIDEETEKLWFREQLKPGWIQFTGVGGSDVSAEFYCHKDVLNYDNYDFIKDLTLGSTYHCAAWNVEEKGRVVVTKFNDVDMDGEWEKEEVLAGWTMTLKECAMDDLLQTRAVAVPVEMECEGDTKEQITDDNGEAVFEVKRGIYQVDEILQEDWLQSGVYCVRPELNLNFNDVQQAISLETNGVYETPMNRAIVFPGETVYCYVGNYEKTIDVTVEPVCIDDFPYLNWNIKSNFPPTQFVLNWFTASGNDAGDPADQLEYSQTFAPGDSEVNTVSGTGPTYEYEGTIIWPGSNDDQNNPQWTGWEFVNGVWVANPDVNYGNLRPDARLDVTVNPTESTTAVYPPATPECAPDPTNPSVLSATTTSSQLAETGDYTSLLSVFVGLTIIVLVGAVRRVEATTE